MISCKYIPFLQDFVNFKSFFDKIKAKELLKEESKGADVKAEGIKVIEYRPPPACPKCCRKKKSLFDKFSLFQELSIL
jgi:hypothetical protein